MECKRLVMESVERFRDERVSEKLLEAGGRSREEIDVGKEEPAAITL